MKNIHLFETKNAYEEAKNGLIVPRVAYIKEKQVVDYNPHHDYVEIAGIKWATMNVGASSSADTGLYFQWGDIQGYTQKQIKEEHKKKFADDWSDYKWYDKDEKRVAKYVDYIDGKMELESVDDAVHANWGGSWRMPTRDEFKALYDAVKTGTVTKSLESKNGVYGLLLTEGDKELFFPACGYAYDGRTTLVDTRGYYWSSSVNVGNSDYAYFLNFDDSYVDWQKSDFKRYRGFAVRGVLDEK